MKHSRRFFLGGAAAIGSSLTGCGDDSSETVPEPEPVFLHGVASGDPLTDAVIIWTRVTTSETELVVEWEIASDKDMTDVLDSGEVTTNADSDFTVKVDVTGLSPATTYFYRFFAAEQPSPVGRAKTLAEGSPERAKLAIVSCASYAHGYFHSYKALSEIDDLDAVIHLGDYIYEYGNEEYGAVRTYDPPHEIITLEDYRKRYSHYRKDAWLQAAHQQHAWFVIWDDHELANDAWTDGAENHDEATEGKFSDRRAAAARAYSEWMPLRAEDPNKIFRSFSYGDLFQLFLLDTRLWGRDQAAVDKDDPAIADPERTLLGDDQEAWLFDGLKASAARWKLVGQQVMMAVLPLEALINTDQWDGYVPARERFYNLITTESLNDVIVLTGDIHTSWASDLYPEGTEYDPTSGAGSIAVEMVAPAVSAPGLPPEIFSELGNELVMSSPNFKFVDVARRGYLVLEVTPTQAEGTYFLFDQIEAEEATSLPPRKVLVKAGENRMTASS